MENEEKLTPEEQPTAAETAKSVVFYILGFFKWVLLAGVLGVFCGAVGAGFHKTIDIATETRMLHTWLVWLLPLAGVATLLLYKLCRVSLSAGTNLIIESAATNEKVPILLAPLIFVGTSLSHLCGASVGREGAALQLGGSLGHNFGKLLHLDAEDTRVLTMCGMAACFSALFGTPLTAAVFVIEVITVGAMRYSAFLPCIAAAYSSYLTANFFGVEPANFAPVNGVPALTADTALRVAGLAVLLSLLSIVFCKSVHTVSHISVQLVKNPYLRIALGGLAMAVLTQIFDLYDYNGAGSNIIVNAVNGSAQPFAFLIKLLLTALCVGVGFRGGEIVPTMFIGATFGCVVGPLLGLPADFAAALCLIALFCSVVNCPAASLFLAVEVIGTCDLSLFAIAAAITFVLSGYFGLYSSQRIVYSKVKQKIINIKTQ